MKLLINLLYCFLIFIVLNNLVSNCISFFLGYNYIYINGVVCKSEINYNGWIVIVFFIIFKGLLLLSYLFYNVRWIRFYLIIEVLIIGVLLLDFVFNSYLIQYFYSNRPIFVLSLYLFDNYLIQVLISIISLILLRKTFFDRIKTVSDKKVNF